MSTQFGKDYIYLIWKNPDTRKQYTVGQLTKNGQYEFNYGFEVNAAIKSGFQRLFSFNDEDINKVYESDVLFPGFSSRLPDKKRRGIENILKKYDMKEYDEYQLLKKSGAKLPIDNLEFIDPIFLDEDEDINRTFYLAGPRHYVGCEGETCENAIELSVGDQLIIEHDKNNVHDPNAIKVLTKSRKHIGYIPRYYSSSIIYFSNKGYSYSCKVHDVQKENNCNECIRLKLEMFKKPTT